MSYVKIAFAAVNILLCGCTQSGLRPGLILISDEKVDGKQWMKDVK